jgi:hypothetical protein
MRLLGITLLLALLSIPRTGLAHGGHGTTHVIVDPPPPVVLEAPRAPDRAPSVFTSGYRGLLTGAIAGVSAGYLVSRHDSDEPWRSVALGTGIGALSGAALGIGVGLLDLGRDGPGRAHVVMRDTLYGTVFGAVSGAIAGSLFILRTEDPESALLGTTIGALSGAGLGLAIGIVDGWVIRERSARRRYAPVVAATTDVRGVMVIAPAVAGRF